MRFIFLFIAAIAFTSCVRDRGDYHCYGVITEKTTGAPVPGAEVWIYESYDTGTEHRAKFGGVLTTSDGAYDFTTPVRYRGEKSVSLHMFHPCTGSQAKGIAGVFTDSHNDMQVFSHAKLEIVIVNQTPFDQNDSLFDVYIDRPDRRQYVVEGNPSFTGMNVNRRDTTSFFGFPDHVLHYSVKKNGTVQTFTQTITTPDPYAVTTITDTLAY